MECFKTNKHQQTTQLHQQLFQQKFCSHKRRAMSQINVGTESSDVHTITTDKITVNMNVHININTGMESKHSRA